MAALYLVYAIELLLIVKLVLEKHFFVLFVLYILTMSISFTNFANTNVVEINKTCILNFISYIREKKWKYWTECGIDIYFGSSKNAFGCFKSASICKRVEKLKRMYPNVEVISNMHFTRIQYTPLVSMKQIEELQRVDNSNDMSKGYILVLDEMGRLFQSRDYKNFPPEMLSIVTQLRKNKVLVLGTAGDMDDIDINIRKKARKIYECERHYRYLKKYEYNGREYERVTDKSKVPYCIKREWFTNEDLEGYDTNQMQYRIGDLRNVEELSKTQNHYNTVNVEVSKRRKL